MNQRRLKMKRNALVLALLMHCSRREDSDGRTSGSAAAVPAPPVAASAPSQTITPAEKARLLDGIASLQAIIRRRAARGRESEKACECV
jgi:hypothetical protein